MTITAKIGKTAVKLRASADTPRLYRSTYGRDIFEDMDSLTKKQSGAIALRCVWVMAKQAGDTSDSAVQWLGGLKAAPTAGELTMAAARAWLENLKTLTEAGDRGGCADSGAGMTMAFFMQSCLSLGIGISELDLLTVGTVTDMLRERSEALSADVGETCAVQSDFDSF